MDSALATLFSRSVEEVRTHERSALQELLDQREGRVVLFGAGTLGRRALALLTEMGYKPLAFSDNNRSSWGSMVEGTPVLPPAEAAALYGKSALILVTIWNDRHWFNETYQQLTGLGCTLVSSYAPLFWRFPDRFLQLVLLNAPPHHVYEQAEDVLRAEHVWADSESVEIYRANIRWRALGDPRDLPGRPKENTYFPRDLFEIVPRESFLDCGAFDGDTIRQSLAAGGASIGHIDGVEADSISFARLQRFVHELPDDLRSRIVLHPCAVGAKRGQIHFENSGTVDSKISALGSVVEVYPIDELFASQPVSFIKMDIEGAEFDALRGARKVIERDRPLLAICVYHTQDDIWRIPLLIHEMVPGHHLFLRAYEGDGFQTVVYAIPPWRLIARAAA